MSTILITGGHSGIGLECVKRLASNSNTKIVLAGRSPDRMKDVADQLRQNHGTTVSTLPLDTSSLASVREAGARVQSMTRRGEIDSLRAILCNAGGRAFGPIGYSADGFEETFAGNYLVHFLMVHLLVDSLANDGRIILTASGTHDPDTRDGKAVGPSVEPDTRMLANTGKDGGKPLSAGVRYATAKLCIILFAYELHRRLRKAGSGVASIAFDPGSVSGTSFLRGAPPPLRFIASSSFAKWMMSAPALRSEASTCREDRSPNWRPTRPMPTVPESTSRSMTDRSMRCDPRRCRMTRSVPPGCGTIPVSWLG